MRKTTTETAVIQSKNVVSVGPPYGDVRLEIVLRHKPLGTVDPGDAVMVALESGQMDCPMDGCDVSERFDEGKVTAWPARAAHAPSGVLFLGRPLDWIASASAAGRLAIEVPIYQAGRRQFEFDVAGLSWKYKPGKPPKATEWRLFCEGPDDDGEAGRCWRSLDECRNGDLEGCRPRAQAWCYTAHVGGEVCWGALGSCLKHQAGGGTTDCVETR